MQRKHRSRVVTDIKKEAERAHRADMVLMEKYAQEAESREITEFLATSPSEENKNIILKDHHIDHLGLANYYFELGQKDETLLMRAIEIAETFFQPGKMITDEKVLDLGEKLADAYKLNLKWGELLEERVNAIRVLFANKFITREECNQAYIKFMSFKCGFFKPAPKEEIPAAASVKKSAP